MSFRYFWEDFAPGTVFEFGTYVLSKEELLEFARRYDPQPFHVDEKAAEASIFGGLIASGWQTCSIVMRLVCDAFLLESASLGSPGLEYVRWLKPVRPGDALRGRMTVLESRASTTKPDRGTARTKWEAFNQNDELVMVMESVQMMRRRTPGKPV